MAQQLRALTLAGDPGLIPSIQTATSTPTDQMSSLAPSGTRYAWVHRHTRRQNTLIHKTENKHITLKPMLMMNLLISVIRETVGLRMNGVGKKEGREEEEEEEEES